MKRISDNSLNEIKDNIKRIYKKNKDKVPDYLDFLKKQNSVKKRIAKSDNEFLKYM